MTEPTRALTCPNCAQRFAWSPQLAGRKVKCPACQQVMRLPQQPGGAIEPIGGLLKDADKTYDLAESDSDSRSAPGKQTAAARATPSNCPNCNSKLKTGAVICVNCGYHVEKGARIDTQVGAAAAVTSSSAAEAGASALAGLGAYAATLAQQSMTTVHLEEDERRRMRLDYLIPLVLTGTALLGILFNSIALDTITQNILKDRDFKYQQRYAQAMGMPAPSPPSHSISLTRVAFMLVYASVRLIIQFPLMLLAIFLVARWFGSSFGTLGVALLKLLALALFSAMISDVFASLLVMISSGLGLGMIGLIMRLMVSAISYILLCVWLFDMETLEGFVMWLLVFPLPLAILFFLFLTVWSIFA
ncbi:MAG: hypothetical protein IT445_02800 [Phycisphaeraceae bacterium]|nr:hypothetical protein [Phycisphaeraceae bacterium]